jgi:excisionase family DNA binding protein
MPMKHTRAMAATLINREVEFAQFATPAEAGRFLRLSRAMIHKQIGEGQIPARRFGRAVRIPWDWLRAQTTLDHLAAK